MPARRRSLPWVIGAVVLILVAIVAQVPRSCLDHSGSAAAPSEVSVVAVAAPTVSQPCGETARLDVAVVCPTRVDVSDTIPAQVVAGSSLLGRPSAGGPVTAVAPAAPPRPPMGLAVANLAVTRI